MNPDLTTPFDGPRSSGSRSLRPEQNECPSDRAQPADLPAAPVRDATADPTFLVGPLRSGTTLLRLMLDHHPAITWPGEFEYSVAQCGDEGWPDIDAYRQHLRTDRMFQDDGLELDDAPGLDYVTLVRSFLEQLRERGGKPIIGCTIHSRFDRLPEIWPNARFIHLNRDPRDVARSCIGMGWVGNVYHGVDYWLSAERRWDDLRAGLRPDQYTEVQYDELIERPEATLRSICDFLGVEYSPQMLDYHEQTSYSPPDARLVSQWRRKLGDRDIRRIEARVGDFLVRRGYEGSGLPELRLGWAERLYLHLHNRIGRARASIRRFGLPLWIQHVIAQRTGPSAWRKQLQLRVNEVNASHLK